MAHVMLDCETIGIKSTAVILIIGAVKFDPKGTGIIDRLELRPTMEDQEALGRTVDEGTLQWWSTQSESAQEEAFSDRDRIPFKEAMEKLYKFCWNQNNVWSHGASFDVVLMETCWQSLGMNEPWKFSTVRDTRTLFDITGVSLRDGGYVTTHKAVEDAARQAFIVQKAYQKLIAAGVVAP